MMPLPPPQIPSPAIELHPRTTLYEAELKASIEGATIPRRRALGTLTATPRSLVAFEKIWRSIPRAPIVQGRRGDGRTTTHIFIGARKTRIAWDRQTAANSVSRRGFYFDLAEVVGITVVWDPHGRGVRD